MTVIRSTSPVGHPRYADEFPCVPERVASARKLVRAALASWYMEDLTDDGALVVSELMTNAVLHTRCRRVSVSISRPLQSIVRISVMDGSTVLPVRRVSCGSDVVGRGLALVEEVSSQWGVDILPYGKCVWAELMDSESAA